MSPSGAGSSADDQQPSAAPAPISADKVRERVEASRAVLAGLEGQSLHDYDDNGWRRPTTAGLQAEQAALDAGEALEARAAVLAAVELEGVGQSEEITRFRPEGFASRAEFAEYISTRTLAYKAEIEPLAAAMQAADPADRAAMRDELSERAREAVPVVKEALRIENGTSAWDIAEERIHSRARLAALGEQRAMGLPGGKMIPVGAGSNRPAVASLKEALAFYPTEWLAEEDGNATTAVEFLSGTTREVSLPLRVKSTGGRAGYTHIKYDLGRGKVFKGAASLLTISGDHGPTLLASGVSTAMHEYAHRAERLNPQINDIAQVHLARRTSTEGGERTPLEGYNTTAANPKAPVTQAAQDRRPNSEWVRSNAFAERYSGKQYASRGNANSEVFSTGMEGVFAGKFGGLRGAGRWLADPEHTKLILGVLAVVPARKTKRR